MYWIVRSGASADMKCFNNDGIWKTGKVDPVRFRGFFGIVTVALDLPGFIKNQRTGVHGPPSIGKQVMPGNVDCTV